MDKCLYMFSFLDKLIWVWLSLDDYTRTRNTYVDLHHLPPCPVLFVRFFFFFEFFNFTIDC